MKWSAFYASRYQPQLTAGPQLASTSLDLLRRPVVVVATRSQEAGSGERRNVIDSFSQAKECYGKLLDFQEGPSFVDARKSWAEGDGGLAQSFEYAQG